MAVNNVQTLEAIYTRRSVRAFLDECVSDQQMETIIQAAAAAPSGGNAQMRIFISVRNPRRIAAVRALSPGIIGLPPAVIVLCLDRRNQPGLVHRKELAMADYEVGAALQNILLAAQELGLGACAVGSFHTNGLAAFLNLPEGVEPCLLVVLGKPKLVPPAPFKRKLNEIYFREQFEAGHGNG
jgi:nitroreductase